MTPRILAQKIRLTPAELELALVAARHRTQTAGDRNYRQAAGFTDHGSNWDVSIQGAASEVAFCKATGLYFGADSGGFKGPDAGLDWQVRSTRHAEGRLLLRANDNPAHNYALLVGGDRDWFIVGWMEGQHAKTPAYFQRLGPRPDCYLIPQSDLLLFEIQTPEVRLI